MKCENCGKILEDVGIRVKIGKEINGEFIIIISDSGTVIEDTINHERHSEAYYTCPHCNVIFPGFCNNKIGEFVKKMLRS